MFLSVGRIRSSKSMQTTGIRQTTENSVSSHTLKSTTTRLTREEMHGGKLALSLVSLLVCCLSEVVTPYDVRSCTDLLMRR